MLTACGCGRVILNSYTEGHGTAGYDEKNDAMRFTVKADSSVRFYESFTMEVQDLVCNRANLYRLLFGQSANYKQPMSINASGQIKDGSGKAVGTVSKDRMIMDAKGRKIAFVDGQGNLG